ncbi:cysteine proteinase [Russula earlei]|uniref:Cysteine proteinase n=1 Tax=Russula earlei TaxID=71964 RepID=A0ACC0UNU1_9AGAM|nr:cysteine proteinase [Russula earlei]
MLATPLYPTSITSHQSPEAASQYRPAKDIESFNKLLPPVVEFVEGSSSGTFLIAEGRYDPVNGSPKSAAGSEVPAPVQTPQAVHKDPISPSQPSPIREKGVALFSGPIDTSWPKGLTVGSGLINTGNSCFLNSALQCLLHTPPLLHVLLSHNKPQPCRVKVGFCMACSLQAVLEEAHGRRKHAFTPYQVANRLQLIAGHMRRGRQEDSHEFLRYAIDALQKSCLAGHASKADPKIAETTWVHKIFGGKLRSRVTCDECHHNSDTFDSILDLSVDIHGVDTLRDALRKFTAIDYLKGADKYKCEKCKRRVIASKRFTIHEPPVALTIHLKRFSPLGRKVGHPVRYDERLSLAQAVSEDQYGPSYSLYGVISHAGSGPNSGHYYAHVKASNDHWYEMNDDMVTRHHGPPTNMKNAYILFYMREKGQALQAAITSGSQWQPVTPNGIKNKLKKRRMSDTDAAAEPDKKPSQLFIGPLLPSPKVPPARDPQAAVLKKKIEAVSKPAPLKPSNALLSLSQYTDEEDDAEHIGEKVETSTPISNEKRPVSSASVPPPSLPSISPKTFYGSSPSVQGTKRKLQEYGDDSRSHPSLRRFKMPSSVHTHRPFGNPFARTTSVKGSMQGRHGKKRPNN